MDTALAPAPLVIQEPAPPLPVPVDPPVIDSDAVFDAHAAVKSFLLGTATYTLSARASNGDVYGMKVEQLAIAPRQGTTQGAAEARWLTRNGEPIMVQWPGNRRESYSLTSFDYEPSPFKVVNFVENMTTFTKTAEAFSPPKTAKVGESGTLYVMPKVLVNGATTEDVAEWAFEPASSDTAWFCVNERTRTTVGSAAPVLSPVEAKDCALVTPAGAVRGYKADLLGADLTLRFR